MQKPYLSLVLSLLTSYAVACDPARFGKEVLVEAANDAIQMEVFANDDILFTAFWGSVKYHTAQTGVTTTLGKIDTPTNAEIGLLGMAADMDFLNTGHFCVLFTPEEKPDAMQVSRFTVNDGNFDLQTESKLLDWHYDTEHIFHMGGATWMDGKGNLHIGNGDNCHWNPGLPVDFRKDRASWGAFRATANFMDLRGRVLRIRGLHVRAGGLGDDRGTLAFPTISSQRAKSRQQEMGDTKKSKSNYVQAKRVWQKSMSSPGPKANTGFSASIG